MLDTRVSEKKVINHILDVCFFKFFSFFSFTTLCKARAQASKSITQYALELRRESSLVNGNLNMFFGDLFYSHTALFCVWFEVDTSSSFEQNSQEIAQTATKATLPGTTN